MAHPASAQMYSDGYKFLKAVEDKEGEEVTNMLEEPGSTVINARDITNGRTALHIVVDRRDATWLSFLLGKGANPNIADNAGNYPLTSAIRLNFVEGVEMLLHGRNMALMRVLLEAGADPDHYDNSGRSARDYARLGPDSTNLLALIERSEKPESERAGAGTYGPSF
jgi:ankyrin repeat protein